MPLPRAVGVLDLQGGVQRHLVSLRRLGADPRRVRSVRDLEGLTHLVLPGGESTTLRHLLDLFGLTAALERRYRDGDLVLLGTCAGAILLGKGDGPPERFGWLDAEIERNAYGRQLDSFVHPLRVEAWKAEFDGVFIRAPKIRRVGPGVRILSRDAEDPVLIEGPGLLAATFHPELTDSVRVHEHFLAMGRAEVGPR